MKERFETEFAQALMGNRSFAAVTLVQTSGSSPQQVGAKMLVFPDGTITGTVGGGTVEFQLIDAARKAIADKKAQLLPVELKEDAGMICGGAMTFFIEPMLVQQPIYIFGCGHVSRMTAPLLDSLDFGVTVVDDRQEWADPAAFPAGVRVVCEEFSTFREKIEGLDSAWVLVMTRAHSFDWEMLRYFADRKVGYLGIMASRNKAAQFREKLAVEGVDVKNIAAVNMPLGLPIGSQTPAEIAVSVAGQLIRQRHA
jgi:xanthine dehydrogenase accessory factor